MRYLSALALLLLLTGGCASSRDVVSVAWRTPYALQPVKHFATDGTQEHRVRISFRNHQFEFLGLVEREGDKLVMAGFFPAGLQLFLMKVEGNTITHFEAHSKLPRRFKPEYMLGEFQLMKLPLRTLQAGGLKVEQVNGVRTIYKNGKPVIEITYSDPGNIHASTITSVNLSRGYTIVIEPLLN